MRLTLPPGVHRAALRIAHGLRLAWWRVRRPEIRGCNAVVINAAGEVLLVRHSYQSSKLWMLPGGGIARGETPDAAAVREVAEEAACRLVGVRAVGVETVRTSGARNHIHLVVARTADEPRPDGREIVAAAFFAPDALPATTACASRRRVARCLGLQNSAS